MRKMAIVNEVFFMSLALLGIVIGINESDLGKACAWLCALLWCFNCFLRDIAEPQDPDEI